MYGKRNRPDVRFCLASLVMSSYVPNPIESGIAHPVIFPDVATMCVQKDTINGSRQDPDRSENDDDVHSYNLTYTNEYKIIDQ